MKAFFEGLDLSLIGEIKKKHLNSDITEKELEEAVSRLKESLQAVMRFKRFADRNFGTQ